MFENVRYTDIEKYGVALFSKFPPQYPNPPSPNPGLTLDLFYFEKITFLIFFDMDFVFFDINSQYLVKFNQYFVKKHQ